MFDSQDLAKPYPPKAQIGLVQFLWQLPRTHGADMGPSALPTVQVSRWHHEHARHTKTRQ